MPTSCANGVRNRFVCGAYCVEKGVLAADFVQLAVAVARSAEEIDQFQVIASGHDNEGNRLAGSAGNVLYRVPGVSKSMKPPSALP